jgi:hypothetical protein
MICTEVRLWRSHHYIFYTNNRPLLMRSVSNMIVMKSNMCCLQVFDISLYAAFFSYHVGCAANGLSVSHASVCAALLVRLCRKLHTLALSSYSCVQQ